MEYNKKFQLWCTSHLSLEEIEKEYGFKETENLKLYYTKAEKEGKTIDKYSYEFGGFTAMYYVWKNNLKSDIVGFCEYRRYFNKDLIDLERIKRGELQTYEGQIGFWHPRTKRYNNVIEWCLMFKYPTYVIYEFAKTLSKYFNKNLNSILKAFENKDFFKYTPGRQMYICTWDKFDKLMTIYNDFLNQIIPGFDRDVNSIDKYLENEKILLQNRYNIGDLKNDPDQNFYYIGDNKVYLNHRVPAYYGETFLGIILMCLYNGKIFQNTYNYFVDITEMKGENNLINEEYKNIILDFYNKSLYKGVREFRIYTDTSEDDENLFEKDIDCFYKYNKLGIVSKDLIIALLEENKRDDYINEYFYDKNMFLKFDKESNTFIFQ